MTSTLNGLVTPSTGRFRMRRSDATMLGFTSKVDARVAKELSDLDELLRRRIVDGSKPKQMLTGWSRLPLSPRRHATVAPPAPAPPSTGKSPAPRSTAAAPATPAATGASRVDVWDKGSLAAELAGEKVDPKKRTIAEVLDADPKLAQIRNAFDAALDERWNELDLAQRTVLGYRGIRDLLISRAALAMGIEYTTAAVNFVVTDDERGVPDLTDYALIGAARKWVYDRNLAVADISDDGGETVKAVQDASLSLTENGFEPALEQLIERRIRNQQFDPFIKAAKLDWMTPHVRELLYEKIRALPAGRLTLANAPHLLPIFAADIAASTVEPPTPTTTGDDPFKVDFFVEDSAQLQISTAAVKCASQLYYVMTLGDELGVFDAVRFFTHRYLFRDGFAVEDRTLRRDLENYVFSEQFPGHDEEAGETRLMHVTHDAERRSFYRQVFNLGTEPVPGDGLANTDFNRLWKILMLESARFLERAQVSPHPDSYVSKQNVMQAVEDVQYNLSTSCVGMATVMTPLMYAELDFVVKRILGHEEVRKHIVPSGGSWWKVVEKLAAVQGRRTRASVLHNKARLGYSLLRQVAEYTPSRFEQDDVFSAFISDVDAFITTQSILQEEEGDALLVDPDDGAAGDGTAPGMPPIPGMPTIPGLTDLPGMPVAVGAPPYGNGSSPSATPRDEWDF